MAQVSNLAELQTALANRDSDIQLTADILVPRQLTLSYAVTIGSLTAQTLYTLRKGAGFSGSLFRVEGGALTLRYIVLDGAQAGHYSENANNRSLVIVVGGALRLESGAVLQSNSSYQEGGGVYLSGDPSYVNTLEISGDARIVGCSSRTSGGGMMAALRNPGDRVIVREQALFSQNSAGDGGGVYVRSYVQGVGGPLTLADAVRITGNEAERKLEQ